MRNSNSYKTVCSSFNKSDFRRGKVQPRRRRGQAQLCESKNREPPFFAARKNSVWAASKLNKPSDAQSVLYEVITSVSSVRTQATVAGSCAVPYKTVALGWGGLVG